MSNRGLRGASGRTALPGHSMGSSRVNPTPCHNSCLPHVRTRIGAGPQSKSPCQHWNCLQSHSGRGTIWPGLAIEGLSAAHRTSAGIGPPLRGQPSRNAAHHRRPDPASAAGGLRRRRADAHRALPAAAARPRRLSLRVHHQGSGGGCLGALQVGRAACLLQGAAGGGRGRQGAAVERPAVAATATATSGGLPSPAHHALPHTSAPAGSWRLCRRSSAARCGGCPLL